MVIRFIPARAGNISETEQGGKGGTVHPRACGEHQINRMEHQKGGGSSPRVRGTSRNSGSNSSFRRFIPARAGNISENMTIFSITPVHPRACGEHAVVFAFVTEHTGSSPRVRGTSVISYFADGFYRFIPARAGNIDTTPKQDRFIPARAGNIREPAATVCYDPVHPRACGEHPESGHARTSCHGSSPRVRGT